MSVVFPLVHQLRFAATGSLALAHGNNVFVYDRNTEELTRVTETDKHVAPVRCVAWNQKGDLLATSGDDKKVKVWNDSSCIYTTTNSKKVTSVQFVGDSHVAFADMFGEVFYSQVPTEAKPDLVLGHVSIITSMLLSPQHDFILTADRDDKIRVSRFPNAYSIHSFCLGHTGYLTNIIIPDDAPTLVISGSGDGTVKVWNYLEGKLLNSVTPSESQGAIAIPTAYNKAGSKLVVLVEGGNNVFIYKLDGNQLSLQQTLDVGGVAVDAQFDADGLLWVCTDSGIRTYSTNSSGVLEEAHSELLTKLNAVLKEKVEIDPSATLKTIGFGRFSKKDFAAFKRQKTEKEAAEGNEAEINE